MCLCVCACAYVYVCVCMRVCVCVCACAYVYVWHCQGGDEADAVASDIARLLAAQGNHRRRAQELREREEVEVKVRETQRTESLRLLPGIRCSVASLPAALLWCPSAGEPRDVSLECETREAVVVQRMRPPCVADAQCVFVST
jgi:hypothetical protein